MDKKKFLIFVESLKTTQNTSVLESIIEGYYAIYETTAFKEKQYAMYFNEDTKENELIKVLKADGYKVKVKRENGEVLDVYDFQLSEVPAFEAADDNKVWENDSAPMNSNGYFRGELDVTVEGNTIKKSTEDDYYDIVAINKINIQYDGEDRKMIFTKTLNPPETMTREELNDEFMKKLVNNTYHKIDRLQTDYSHKVQKMMSEDGYDLDIK